MISQAPIEAASAVHPGPQRWPALLRRDWRLTALLLGSSAFLCANLFSWRLRPFVLGGDPLYFSMNAQRMLYGERIYRDFMQFTPPGTDLVYLTLFRVFGPRIWVVNVLVLGVGVLLAGLCYAIGRRVMDRSQALVAASLFLVLIYSKPLGVTHHWLSTLAVLAATLLLMKGTDTTRLLAAGALLGVASFFTQTRGVVAGAAIAACLAWEALQGGRRPAVALRQAGLLAAAFCASLGALSAYFVSTTGLSALWYLEVIYPSRYVRGSHAAAAAPGQPSPLTLHSLATDAPVLAAYVLLPLVCGLTLLQRLSAASGASRRPGVSGAGPVSLDPVLLLAGVASALIAETTLDISWLRLYCVALPAVILGVRLLGTGPRRGWAHAALWLGVAALGTHQIWARQSGQDQLLDLKGGRVAAAAPLAERLRWLAQHAHPGDRLFQADWPAPYLPLGVRNPVYLDILEPNRQTRPEWVLRSVRDLERQPVRYIVWAPHLDPQPTGRAGGEYNLAPFVALLHRQYRRVWTFSDGHEVWERIP